MISNTRLLIGLGIFAVLMILAAATLSGTIRIATLILLGSLVLRLLLNTLLKP